MVDAQRLKKNFAAVGAHGDEVAMFFYSHLFLSHPETRDMFPVSMMRQRDKLLTALGQIVTDVDNLDDLVPFLRDLGTDHRKFGAIAGHYPAVGGSLIATLKHFSGPDWSPELEADWATAYGLVAEVMTGAAAQAEQVSPPWWDAPVVAHERRTVDIAVVTVRPEYRYDYTAGQSFALETTWRPRLWRYYSPANAPREDNTIDLHVRLVDGGPVSGALVRSLAVGDVVRMGSPMGRLTIDHGSPRDLLLVAGGTGLAPLKALIEEMALLDRPRHVHLVWGARTAADLYDLADLARLDRQLPWLTVTPTVSHDPTFAGEHGLASEVAVAYQSWPGRDVYVCGSPRMVEGTVGRLFDVGVPPERIRVDEFTSQ